MKEKRPPRWATWFLRLYCRPEVLDVIEGDLLELFLREAELQGNHQASRNFSWRVLRFFRVRYIKSLEDFDSMKYISMLKNYFKISFRMLIKGGTYSFLNIFGLAVGLCCSLLIMMHVRNELSYDQFYPEADRIYRTSINTGGNSPALLVHQLKLDYPEIEEGVRIYSHSRWLLDLGQKSTVMARGMKADSTFFKIFPRSFISGDPGKALSEPHSMVITSQFALKYFPGEDPINRILKAEGETYKVTGIVAGSPRNTHLPYDFVLSMPINTMTTEGDWTGNNFKSYIKLKPGTNQHDLSRKFRSFIKRHIAPELLKYTGHDSFEDFLASGYHYNLTVTPIKDIHLHHPRFSFGRDGDYQSVWIIGLVAIMILSIACINYVNMSTARSAIRFKEVGIRKALGFKRKDLMIQFLVEALVVTILAILLALLLSFMGVSLLNDLTNNDFQFADLFDWGGLIGILILILLVVLLAGGYPAFYISGLSPVTALKGGGLSKGGRFSFRRGLLTFQFTVSMFLIGGTLIVFGQVTHMSNAALGLDAEQVLIIKNISELKGKVDVFRNQVLSNTHVEGVTLSSHYPSAGMSDWTYHSLHEDETRFNPYNLFTDHNYLDVMGIQLKEGRFFSAESASDTTNILINETAVKKLGWTDPLGKTLTRGQGSKYTVIGVLRDFKTKSARRSVRPVVIRYGPEMEGEEYSMNFGAVRITGNFDQAVDFIKSNWESVVSDYPFSFIFLNNSFDRLYNRERNFGKLFTLFAGLAIIIAMLGLVSLVAFTVEKRFKEIAIRKVLGASIASVVGLFLMDFAKLLLLAALVFLPIEIYLGQQWLNDFATRITLEWFYLVIPVAVIAIFSILIVSFQAWKASNSDPAFVLKQE
ncbi:MAG: ABC transporter permease [Cyclobacteriaceae bacterium]|nr:ABC transporter permease [Cyclobacteriaceae bacterium HetDA_MAG_MS6]